MRTPPNFHRLLNKTGSLPSLYWWWHFLNIFCPVSYHIFALFLSSIPLTSFSVVQLLSHVQLCNPKDCKTPSFPMLLPSPRVCSNSSPLSWWCHPAISSSVIPFSSCPQSLPASGSYQISQLFASRGQSTGVSASTSVPPMNTQGWSSLGWTGWIFLQSKGLSRVFSNTTVQKHQFFSTQLSSQSNSHIQTWPLEKP